MIPVLALAVTLLSFAAAAQQPPAPEAYVPKARILRNQDCASIGVSMAALGPYQLSRAPGRLRDDAVTTITYMPSFPDHAIIELEWNATIRWFSRPRVDRQYRNGKAQWFGPTGAPMVISYVSGEYYELETITFPKIACHRIEVEACPTCPPPEEAETPPSPNP